MRQLPKVISLDGADWQLSHLMPSESENRKVWEDGWKPEDSATALDPPIRGTVPGDVISDALDAGLIPDPYVDMNSRACEWLSQRDWVYVKEFTVEAPRSGEVLRLLFEGVDFGCQVYLNGELLGAHDAMFTPFGFDVTEKVRTERPNRLVVVVEHAPPVTLVQGQVGHTSRALLWKARFAYNWDWCTRLIPLGVWRSVTLLRTGPTYLRDVWVRQEVEPEAGSARVKVQVNTGGATGGDVSARLMFAGSEVASSPLSINSDGRAVGELDVPDPHLWWPNGMGEQPLYDLEVAVSQDGSVSDMYKQKLGLRKLRVVQNEGAPAGALPYTFEVNDRSVFVRGWNWVPVDHMYGRDQGEAAPPALHPIEDRYGHLVGLAKYAHANLLRVWGGGLLESRKFYNYCDKYGILVWQEFPHSSSGIDNHPRTDEGYLHYIKRQSRRMIPLRRNYTCLAAWCGGNELMDPEMNPLGSDYPPLRVLHEAVQDLDPERPWFPASPSGPAWHADVAKAGKGEMHDVHGPWKYSGPEEHYKFYNAIDPLLHSEFGVEGCANLSTLRRYLSEKYLWPPTSANPAWVHHGSWWLHLPMIESLFGRTENIEDFCRFSQWMQAEGLRYAAEAHRRRTGHCSGVIPWQFNEAFPNAACTNVVDYLGEVKPAYWWLRRAYAPISVSLKYDRLTSRPGQEWQAEVWAVSSEADTLTATPHVEVYSLAGERVEFTGVEKNAVTLESDKPIAVGQLHRKLSEGSESFIVFIKLVGTGGEMLASNEYIFSTTAVFGTGLRKAPQASLRVVKRKDQIFVKNEGEVPCFTVSVVAKGKSLPCEGFFCLAPHEKRLIATSGAEGEYTISAWNADEVLA